MTKLTKDEWNLVIATMGAAPLNNMVHAQQVDQLIAKVMDHAGLKAKVTPGPARRARKK